MHYEEMTDSERASLIQGYWNLGGANGTTGLVAEIANFHGDNFNLIHFNDEATDVFFAWHRQASQELERALKNSTGNEWLVIPYWNWTLSPLKSDDLWQEDWLGPFNSAWGLNRAPSSNDNMNLQSQVDAALMEDDF